MVRIKFYWDIIDESFHIFSFVSWVRTKVAVDKGEMVWLSGVRGKESWEGSGIEKDWKCSELEKAVGRNRTSILPLFDDRVSGERQRKPDEIA